MGTLIILGMVGIPCLVTLIWFLTPFRQEMAKSESHDLRVNS